MNFTNTEKSWGLVSILFHWISAVVVIALFALGVWMVELDYYDDWYRIAPNWHRSIGVLLVSFFILRLIWRKLSPPPKALAEHKPIEKKLSSWVHVLLYMLTFLLLPSGYFITTAQGQALDVFNWFSLPATVTSIANLEDIAGVIHQYTAYSIIALVVLHAAGALKHHFIDKDSTLKRMLGSS